MAANTKLDRRHDINAGERLPERFTRVLDDSTYRDNLEAVQTNEASEEFQKAREAQAQEAVRDLQYKKDRTIPGAVVVLRVNGAAFHRVDAVSDTGVKIGPFWYGWECIEIPSQELVDMVQSEVGAI